MAKRPKASKSVKQPAAQTLPFSMEPSTEQVSVQLEAAPEQDSDLVGPTIWFVKKCGGVDNAIQMLEWLRARPQIKAANCVRLVASIPAELMEQVVAGR